MSDFARQRQVWRIQHAIWWRCSWFRLPIFRQVYTFWATLFEEGPKGAVDAMCFSYLNDRNPAWRWCYGDKDANR